MTSGLPRERWAYPTSLLLESFAQSAAILWFQTARISAVADNRVPIFLAARHCKFHGFAYPGDVLRHEARISAIVRDHLFVEGETFVGDRSIAVIDEIVAAIEDRRTLVNGARDPMAARPPSQLGDRATKTLHDRSDSPDSSR